jgi:hypothetical protein
LSRVYDVRPERLDAVRRPRRRATVESTPATGAATRLALAEAEVQAMKDMLAEIRASHDDWKAQAERLALAGPIIAASPPAPTAPPAPGNRRSWWPWRRVG